jgi:hypothetical protein
MIRLIDWSTNAEFESGYDMPHPPVISRRAGAASGQPPAQEAVERRKPSRSAINPAGSGLGRAHGGCVVLKVASRPILGGFNA